MKNKKDLSKINGENADKICSKVREASDAEAELLLEKAHKERERILAEAAAEARLKAQSIISLVEKDIAQKRDKIFSTVNMEKKRISLEARSLFVSDVISLVRQEAEKFRQDPGYAKFLKDAILEGVKVVDDKKAQVFYSGLDEALISQMKDLGVEFKKSDFSEPGVIVQAKDGRSLFDNRFSARLKRLYDDIYVKLLKEAF